jgi:hypothetical protein
LTIVSKRASKVFSNPQHSGNRQFLGGQGAKLQNGNTFSKTKINVFVRQQVTKVSNINKIFKFSNIIPQVWEMHITWLAHNNSSFLFK